MTDLQKRLFHQARIRESYSGLIGLRNGDVEAARYDLTDALAETEIKHAKQRVPEPEDDDMTFVQFREVMQSCPRRKGTFDDKFVEMLRVNTEDGAMKWIALHLHEFSDSLRPMLSERMKIFASEHHWYAEWLGGQHGNHDMARR